MNAKNRQASGNKPIGQFKAAPSKDWEQVVQSDSGQIFDNRNSNFWQTSTQKDWPSIASQNWEEALASSFNALEEHPSLTSRLASETIDQIWNPWSEVEVVSGGTKMGLLAHWSVKASSYELQMEQIKLVTNEMQIAESSFYTNIEKQLGKSIVRYTSNAYELTQYEATQATLSKIMSEIEMNKGLVQIYKGARFTSKYLPVAIVGMSAYEIYKAYRHNDNVPRVAMEQGGLLAGTFGGAAAGAYIAGPVGLAVGLIAGGFLASAGKSAADYSYDKFLKNDLPEIYSESARSYLNNRN